jgi:hypothetical protein
MMKRAFGAYSAMPWRIDIDDVETREATLGDVESLLDEAIVGVKKGSGLRRLFVDVDRAFGRVVDAYSLGDGLIGPTAAEDAALRSAGKAAAKECAKRGVKFGQLRRPAGTIVEPAPNVATWVIASYDGTRQFQVTIDLDEIEYPTTDVCSGYHASGESDADPGYTWIRIPYEITNINQVADRTNFSFAVSGFRLVDLDEPEDWNRLEPNVVNFNVGDPCEDQVLRGDYDQDRGILPGGSMHGTFMSTWQLTGPNGFGIQYHDPERIVEGPVEPVPLPS